MKKPSHQRTQIKNQAHCFREKVFICFLGSSPGSFHLSFFKARQPQVNILIIVLFTYILLQIWFDFWDTKISPFEAIIPLDRLCSGLSCVGPMKPGRTKELFRIQSARKVWRKQKGLRSGTWPRARPALLSLLCSHRLNSKKLFCPIRSVPTETLATQANPLWEHNPKRWLQRILKYLRIHFVWVLMAVFSKQR